MLGDKIKLLRLQNQKTLEEMAQLLDVDLKTMQDFEDNIRPLNKEQLKKISTTFNITIDELLESQNDAKKIPNYAKTIYNKESLQIIEKINYHTRLKIIGYIFSLIIFIVLLLIHENFLLSLVECLCYFGLAFLACYLCSLMLLKKAVNIYKGSCEFYFYLDHFIIETNTNKGFTKYQRLYSSISKMIEMDKFIIIYFDNQIAIIDKTSFLYDPLPIILKMKEEAREYQLRSKNKKTKSQNFFKTHFINAMAILSVVSFFLGIILIKFIKNPFLFSTNLWVIKNLWVLYFLLPIDFISIILGIIYKRKRNIVIGSIMSALLILVGTFPFIFKNTYSFTTKPIETMEKITKMDYSDICFTITKINEVNTQKEVFPLETTKRSEITYLKYSQAEEMKIEKNLASSNIWSSTNDKAYLLDQTMRMQLQDYDYWLFYDLTNESFTISLDDDNINLKDYMIASYDIQTNTFVIINYFAK